MAQNLNKFRGVQDRRAQAIAALLGLFVQPPALDLIAFVQLRNGEGALAVKVAIQHRQRHHHRARGTGHRMQGDQFKIVMRVNGGAHPGQSLR